MTRAIGTLFLVLGIIAALVTGVALVFPESAQSLYSFALPHIAPVDHIFDLVRTKETIEAEDADEPT